MKQIDLREGARRQHRAVSLFAVIQCWTHGLDGVAFERGVLERLLGLERFKATRVKWLEEDLKEFFPYQQTYYFTTVGRPFASMIVSRIPLKKHLPSGSMSTEERLKKMAADGPKIALFKLWTVPSEERLTHQFDGAIPFFADAANFDERFLASYLNLLAQGQISPKNLPPLTVTGA
jgi:hypothetical protein